MTHRDAVTAGDRVRARPDSSTHRRRRDRPRAARPAGGTGARDDLLDARVFEELHALVGRLARARDVRAVVVEGPRPGVFAPHFRLGEVADGGEALGMRVPRPLAAVSLAAVSSLRVVPGADSVLARTPLGGVVTLLRTHEALSGLGRLPQLVVAAIGGDAMGGGCELALACDVRVMAAGPWLIGLPEVSAGIPPGAGGTARLARAVGPARATSMILRSRVLTPEEARDAGLVDEVVPPGALVDTALRIARAGAARDPGTVASVKRTMHGGPGLARALRREAAGFMAVASSGSAHRRLRVFEAGSSPDAATTPWRSRAWVTTGGSATDGSRDGQA